MIDPAGRAVGIPGAQMIPAEATWIRFPRFIGDAVMHFPILDALREVAGTPLVVWGPRLTVGLLEGTDLADALVPDPPGKPGALALARTLRMHKAARSVHFPKSLRPALAAFLAGVPERLGVSESLAGLFNTHTAPFWKGEGTCLDRYWRVLRTRWPGLRDPAFRPFRSPFRVGLPEVPYLCLMPGASNPAKTWPAERFAELAERAADSGLLPVVLGGPAERELGARVAGTRGLNRCGDTLQEAAAWMAGSVGAVGNDSGLGHLAAATGIPVLVLAGPMEPEMFRPFGPRVDLVAVPGLPCAPCGRKDCNVPGHPCLLGITPGAAWDRLQALMATPPPGP
jgi:ADP-heptose:LPS heptosyltransferase